MNGKRGLLSMQDTNAIEVLFEFDLVHSILQGKQEPFQSGKWMN